MIVGVCKETFPGERRVALNPDVVPSLAKKGLEVLIEAGAGFQAGFTDAVYEAKEARIGADRSEVFSAAAVLLQVRSLGANPEAGQADLELLRKDQTVVGLSDPLGAPAAAKELADRGVTAFSMELIPRITRAQSMDVLSSMATIAGYKAALLAAAHLPRMFPMSMTAAGTIAPARVFVIGAGVAGLQAIASSKRLGAVVNGYDVRPAVKEQVESLGAKFVEMDLETGEAEDKDGYAKELGEDFYHKQRELMTRVVAQNDVVITTAAVPGKKSPVLVTAEMVKGMAPGSVIVDLAAERGGNCELTRADDTVTEHGVTILGPTNLPSTVPYHASQMYAKNISTFLLHLVQDEELNIDTDDEITRETLVSRNGEVVHQRVRELLGLKPAATATERSEG
ncbi:MAG: Re/Si-specific NAD(P)(+) transhydrogenase subunit alpha [Planctomycetota bacterium]|jgi:NAD(P) transhydrogenase subunit alpha